ncbi:hypothetical protein EX30DRAFT_337370 [Ascodesmis nigricans]|uniref:AA9 family lytic polysaccharide monooxygenase n=1 Tax=Ascodesmis nigricans TaxID=341454 RepID=A0A4S2N6H1_9PEZI|nr:hypothetical protein EX30DRAFT_337370 [Ascodesmis nigricans]
MKLTNTLLALMAAAASTAHHMVSNFYVDGANQGPGVCLRNPPSTDPVFLNSNAIVCNVNGDRAVSMTCPVNAGARITVQWRTWPDGSRDKPLDGSHQGPCAVYMKRMEHGQGSLAGGGWFKIWHDGVYNGKFCSDRIRENGNKMDFTIPRDLAEGYYALRFESIALHQAQNEGGAQFYIGCAQIYLRSIGGNQVPRETVSIPGYTTARHPGILYNYWTRFAAPNYQIPGPSPYISTNNFGTRNPTNTPVRNPDCSTGFRNANWCAPALPSFNSESSCYAGHSKCWAQANDCRRAAGATGSQGCQEYERYCMQVKKVCDACGAARNCNGSFPKGLTKRNSLERRHHRDFS